MKRGLLLGNGMNSRLYIKGMSCRKIKERFMNNISKYGLIFEEIFGVHNWNEIPKYILENAKGDGIELLAGCLYDFIMKAL